jgi:hypothetical protein
VAPLQEIRELEGKLEGQAQLPPQQAADLAQNVQDTTERLRSLLYLAGGTINTLAVSTTEVGARGVGVAGCIASFGTLSRWSFGMVLLSV